METITKNIPALALRGLTVFPRMTASFDVEREISVRALERAMETGQEIFLVTQRELGVDVAFFAFERGNFLLELFDLDGDGGLGIAECLGGFGKALFLGNL